MRSPPKQRTLFGLEGPDSSNCSSLCAVGVCAVVFLLLFELVP